MKFLVNEVMVAHEKQVLLYELINNAGCSLEVLNLGASMTKLCMPDRDGRIENIVLNYANMKDYCNNDEYFGSTIGRTAGRIGGGDFSLDGTYYALNRNNGNHSLHGGSHGFHSVLWNCIVEQTQEEIRLTCEYISSDGEENYPGNLHVTATYTLNNMNHLSIKFTAECDRATLLNMTNHAYFNLSGDRKRNVMKHFLKISSNNLVEIDHECIPTGKILEITDTPFDFRLAKAIGKDLNANHEQLIRTGGYDHPWILDKSVENAIELFDEESGRGMLIKTDCSHVVVYTMNNTQGKTGQNGNKLRKWDGICLETQSCPIGYDNLFSEGSELKKGELYQKETRYEFYVR